MVFSGVGPGAETLWLGQGQYSFSAHHERVAVESPLSILTLHRHPGRHLYFSEAVNQTPLFDPASKMWIITNPVQCKDLIASGNLRPATYAEDYAELEARLGFDFSNLIFALNHIPLCPHGEAHLRARRRVSEFLLTRKPVLSARVPVAVETHFEALRNEGKVELMSESVLPLVLDIISVTGQFESCWTQSRDWGPARRGRCRDKQQPYRVCMQVLLCG